MPRATRREITQSLTDHKADRADQGQAPKRHANRGLVAHTSTSHPKQLRPMYCRAKADASDRFWRTLGKQVRAGARITVRG